MSLVLAVLLVSAAGFGALNVAAYNHAHRMMHFAEDGERTARPEALSLGQKARTLMLGVNVPRPDGQATLADLAPGCAERTIPVTNDVTLAGWHVDAGADAPLVILFHGYSADKSSLIGEAGLFRDMGFSVLLVDFRGSGGSSEDYTTLGVLEAEDVAAVCRYVAAELQPSATILYGQSMGAVAILRAVHQHGVRPDAVILEAVFDSMLCTVRNRFRAMRVPSFPSAELLVFWGGRQWGFNGFRHNPVEYASSLTSPALFMHGAEDARAALAEGRRVYASVRAPSDFEVFDGVGHESYAGARPAQWESAVREFLADTGLMPGNSPDSGDHAERW